MPICAAISIATTMGCASEQTATRSDISPIEAGVGSIIDGPATLGTGGSTGGTGGGAGGTKPAPSSGGSRARIIEAGATRTDADAAKPIGSLDCDELHSAWLAFVESHQSCSVDADCETYEVYDGSTCDNPPGLSHALAKGASELAGPYAARYFELKCGGDPEAVIREPGTWSEIGWDGLPVDRAACEHGTCFQIGKSCIAGGFDSGTP